MLILGSEARDQSELLSPPGDLQLISEGTNYTLYSTQEEPQAGSAESNHLEKAIMILAPPAKTSRPGGGQSKLLLETRGSREGGEMFV